MSRMYILLITMPLLLAFRVSNFGCRSSHSRPRFSLQATTARAPLDSGDYGTPVDRFAHLDLILKFIFYEELDSLTIYRNIAHANYLIFICAEIFLLGSFPLLSIQTHRRLL